MGRRGIKPLPQQRTMQTKINSDPPPPCKKSCGRKASKSRKDGLCENCGVFADKAEAKKKRA